MWGVPVVGFLRKPFLACILRHLGLWLRLMPPAPRCCVVSTRQWLEAQSGDGLGSFKQIIPETVLQKKAPQSIYERYHWRFDRYMTQTAPPVFVATLKNASVVGSNGSVVGADGVVLYDLSKEWFFGAAQHSLLFRLKLPSPRKLTGRTATVAVASGWNYYHWLLDVLPRFGILEKAGIEFGAVDSFIVNHGESPYKTQTLELLGISKGQLLEIDRGDHYQCEELLAPSLVAVDGQSPQWAVQYLREKFLPKCAGMPKGPERVYLSRGRAKYRRFTNEETVRPFLLKCGFKEVFTEEMTFLEQVNLFASAKVIAGPHGAGFSNLVFCSPGTKVVEAFSPYYVNGCFWALANWAFLDYYYLLGSGQRLPDGRDPHRVEQDIQVDLNELKKTLRLAHIID